MGFHHIGQAGLELLTSGDLPASTSQSAGITGVSHHSWTSLSFLTTLSRLLNTVITIELIFNFNRVKENFLVIFMYYFSLLS